jgi:hypothetical protein
MPDDFGIIVENILALRHTVALYRAALQEIKDTYGKVCPYFEECHHDACRSSAGAWQVADRALREEEKNV